VSLNAKLLTVKSVEQRDYVLFDDQSISIKDDVFEQIY